MARESRGAGLGAQRAAQRARELSPGKSAGVAQKGWQRVARWRAGGATLSRSVAQGHTEVHSHTHERAHAHAQDTNIPRAHAEAPAFRAREGAAESNGRRGAAGPSRRAPTRVCATGGGSGGRRPRAAEQSQARRRERGELRGGGRGRGVCPHSQLGRGREGRAQGAGAGPGPRRL